MEHGEYASMASGDRAATLKFFPGDHLQDVIAFGSLT